MSIVGRNGTVYEMLMHESGRKGYTRMLLLTHCSLQVSLERVQRRGDRTGRFVPELRAREIYPLVYASFSRLHPMADRVWVYDSSPPPQPHRSMILSVHNEPPPLPSRHTLKALWARDSQMVAYCSLRNPDDEGSLPPSISLNDVELPCHKPIPPSYELSALP